VICVRRFDCVLSLWCVIGYVLQFGELARKRIHDDDDDKAILPFLMSSPDLSLVCMPTGTVGCLLFTFATDQRFAWLHERLKGSVTAWAVCVWKEVLFKTHQFLLCRIVLAVNQTWRPVLWLFTWKIICDILKLLMWLGQPLALSQITVKKIQYPERKQVSNGYNLVRHVWKSSTCCQYRRYHTTRVKELLRFVITNDLTPHVWQSCDVLSVQILSHDTSERVVMCC